MYKAFEIVSYESTEDMIKAERAAQRMADEAVKPWQAAIKTGDYFTVTTELSDGDTVPIYYEVLETDSTHYRLVRGFSWLCPFGETGEVHVSTADRMMTKEQFDVAVKELTKC